MEHDASRPAGDEVLANLGWVRRLALAIVRDSSAADDVTQEVARVALERGEPVPASGLRAWLGAVTRRLALDRTRSDAARRARERSVARPEGDGSEAEVVERSARQQRVARAVMELAEPYRSTILYRYLDEMAMSEVAQRTNVNEVTARKRLSRGLEMLRARLDTEFGTGTRNWAIALLAPGKVTLIMSTKWIAAGAAALIVGLGWWGWHVTHVAPSANSTSALAAESPLEKPPIDGAVVSTSSPAGQQEAGNDVGKRVSAATPPPTPDVTVIHVRIVDRSGGPVVSGRIEGCWSKTWDPLSSVTRKFIGAEVVSEVTDIVLPPTATSVSLRASVAGHLGTLDQVLHKLREGPTGRVEHDVLVRLDEPVGSPSIRGIVTVDGKRRVPHAFTFLQGKDGHALDGARVNTVDASYLLPNATPRAELRIGSDETIPVSIDLSEEAVSSGVLDLHLSSRVTLNVTLLDRDDGHPLGNEDFLVESRVRIPPNMVGAETRVHTTDAQGRCEVRGLSPGDSVSISPAVEPMTRPIIFSDGWGEAHVGKFMPTTDMAFPLRPWWTQRTPEDKPVFEVTLRVKQTSEGASIFGTVPLELLGGQADIETKIRVAGDELDSKDSTQGNGFDVAIDARGHWAFNVQWPSRYLVWIETVKNRKHLSKEIPVEVAARGPRGPIDLPLIDAKTETNFELLIENVPDGGRTEVSVSEEKTQTRSEDIGCKNGPCTHGISINGPARVMVTWSRGDMQDTQIRRSFKVDPARESSLRIDMGGDKLRTIEFEAKGAPIPGYALLGFGKLDGAGLNTHESGSTTLIDGHAKGQVSLSPGRWFFECFDARRDFNVTGVIEVKAGSDVVHIARDVVAVESAQIPHGIEFTELDGVKLDGLERPIRYTELGPSGKVILNATARYTALP